MSTSLALTSPLTDLELYYKLTEEEKEEARSGGNDNKHFIHMNCTVITQRRVIEAINAKRPGDKSPIREYQESIELVGRDMRSQAKGLKVFC